MAVDREKTSKLPIDDATDEAGTRDVEIDRTAPAGSKNSLGAQSVRDGRPATDDSVVEAMDEEGPGISPIDPGRRGASRAAHSEGMDSFNDCATSSMDVFWPSCVMSASSATAEGRPWPPGRSAQIKALIW